MKTLLFDLETKPAKVYTFKLYQPIIGIEQIIEDSSIMSWSAMWEDKTKVLFASEYHDGRQEMLQKLWDLLDQADVIVTFNGKKFDEAWIRGELIREGFQPYSPVKHIDLYQVAKSNMRLISGKLDWLSWVLLKDRKVEHYGFKLWADCLSEDPEVKARAWRLMKRYGMKDTALMKPILEILRPWIKTGLPNAALYQGSDFACPACGGVDLQKRGYHYTGASKFQRYRCMSCGHWPYDPKRLATTGLRPSVG